MSQPLEINKMILQRIRASTIDPNVKNFMIEVLQFEISTLNVANVRYKDEYMKLIQKHLETDKAPKKS